MEGTLTEPRPPIDILLESCFQFLLNRETVAKHRKRRLNLIRFECWLDKSTFVVIERLAQHHRVSKSMAARELLYLMTHEKEYRNTQQNPVELNDLVK